MSNLDRLRDIVTAAIRLESIDRLRVLHQSEGGYSCLFVLGSFKYRLTLVVIGRVDISHNLDPHGKLLQLVRTRDFSTGHQLPEETLD